MKKLPKINPKKLILYFSALLSLLVITPVIYSYITLAQDLYNKDILHVNSIDPFDFRQYEGDDALAIHTSASVCITTASLEQDIYAWYKNRDWWCDGPCVVLQELKFGLLELDTYKVMSTSWPPSNPIQFCVSEDFTFRVMPWAK